MKILHRFLVAFGLIILIGFVQGATTVLKVHDLAGELDNATSIPISQVDAAWRASDAFHEANAFLANALEAINDQRDSDLIARFKDECALIEQNLALALRDQPNAYGNLAEQTAEWKAASLVLLGETSAVTIPAPHVMERRSQQIRAGLQALVADSLAHAAAARAKIQTAAAYAEIFPVIFGLVGLLIGLGVAIPLALALTRPLQRLKDRMLSMIDGDLDSPIVGQERRDEIGQIAGALHFMRDRLLERRRMEGEAAAVHLVSEQKLRQTERAFEAAGRDQGEIVTILGRALAAIAQGDLTTRVEARAVSDYAKLGIDFNEAIGSIHDTVSTVSAATYSLQSESEDIAQAAVDLSQWSEGQARQLRETAASLKDVSGAIRATATSTRKASEAIAEANVEADQSGVTMREAIGAIGRIEASSIQITQIISVIDQIAFQTNVLALNAAVEAARAGEGGKGFSIVAAEVRSLALRSADAAKQIKELIQQTSENVKDGAALIGRTGEQMGVIMTKVSDINRLVAGVAIEADRQVENLDGIVASVGAADRETQKNARRVGQSAEAAQLLRDQTTILATLVGRFRTDDMEAMTHHAAA